MKQSDIDITMLTKELLEELDQLIAGYDEPASHIIQILHDAQHLFGYIPPAVQLHIAEKTHLPAAKINGIVTFYSFFSEEPKGKYNISVCMGTACFVQGADKVLQAFSDDLGFSGDTMMTEDKIFALSDVRCIGACGLAPVVRVNEKIYGHVQPEDVSAIIEDCRQAMANELEEVKV